MSKNAFAKTGQTASNVKRASIAEVQPVFCKDTTLRKRCQEHSSIFISCIVNINKKIHEKAFHSYHHVVHGRCGHGAAACRQTH